MLSEGFFVVRGTAKEGEEEEEEEGEGIGEDKDFGRSRLIERVADGLVVVVISPLIF